VGLVTSGTLTTEVVMSGGRSEKGIVRDVRIRVLEIVVAVTAAMGARRR
jgi:hypothetical protein